MPAASAPGSSEQGTLKSLVWQLQLADGSAYPQKGQFYALDREVNVRTGAILVKVMFPNPGNVLRPGGFGSISTIVNIQRNALLVPQRAVTELQGGYLVAVVDKANTVSIRPIKVGPRIDSMWIVSEGLKANERIVAEGVQKVRDGMEVHPSEYHPDGLQKDQETTNKAQ